MSAVWDRDRAAKVLERYDREYEDGAVTFDLLDALEGCVRPAPPQGIDRDALLAAVVAVAPAGMELRYDGTEDPVAAAYVAGVQSAHDAVRDALALLRPVEGVVLAPEEAGACAWALDHLAVKHSYDALRSRDGSRVDLRDLAARLEAAS